MCDNNCASPVEAKDKSLSAAVPPRKPLSQHRAFDYTVEKLLRDGSAPSALSHNASTLMMSAPMMPPPTRGASLPFELLAQHLWWQRQQQLRAAATADDATTRAMGEGASHSLSFCKLLAMRLNNRRVSERAAM